MHGGMMKKNKKIIITGANGFVGVRAADYFSRQGYEVIACGHRQLDVTKENKVLEVFQQYKPELVLHCAAISDTKEAQRNKERSEAINFHGTVHVAKASKSCDAKLVYLSSDQVYNGNKQMFPLPEDIPVEPQNIYGVHKLLAEQEVSRIDDRAVGLRLTWLYDMLDSSFLLNQNMLVKLREVSESGMKLRGAVHELRGITFVWDLIERLEACFGLPGGVYNFGCENHYSYYETLCQAAKLCGYDSDALIEKEEEFHRNLSMDTSKIKAYGIAFFDTIQALKAALSRTKPR